MAKSETNSKNECPNDQNRNAEVVDLVCLKFLSFRYSSLFRASNFKPVVFASLWFSVKFFKRNMNVAFYSKVLSSHQG